MSIALYRKYRPKLFGDVTNQNHIKITLQNEIQTDRIGHAYLFCGPRGTGKTTLARLLSKAVNCLDLQEGGEPCNKCASCEDIMGNKALDIIEIDAASHTGVDNVRDNIINNARFTPTNKKYKVYIIDEVHMLSISAFNALLKILEEPPKYVIFILATTEVHKVPATIVSRCQRFDFKKIIFSELVERLRYISSNEGIQVDEQVLALIAKNAAGCVRDAESLLEQVFSLGEKNISLEQAELILPKSDFATFYRLLELLINKNTREAILLINNQVADGLDIVRFNELFIEFLRKILLYKISGEVEELAREVDETIIKDIEKLIKNVSVSRLSQIIDRLLQAKEGFKQSYIVQLPMEMAVVELCGDNVATQGIASSVPPKNVETQRLAATPNEKVETPPVASPKLNNDNITSPNPPQDIDNVETQSAASNTRENSDTQTIASPASNNANVTTITAIWTDVLSKAKQVNYTLYMSLRMAKPVSLENNILTLGFLFELQKQRVESIKTKSELQQLLKKFINQDLEIETTIDKNIKPDEFANGNGNPMPPHSNDNSVDDVINEFGGEIVDKI